ncbi:8-amino-7-oxononanoate synthase [Paenibacillus sp. GCM10027627]|uniref:8-amino-7-oxononanoate synthase n=1 Tax=unclassified Paenibacillus TaxID=185978 RepID=UPI00362D64A4
MKWIEEELDRLKEGDQERKLKPFTAVFGCPGYGKREGKPLLHLSSNDYLGLSQHPSIIEAMNEALVMEGAGSGSSRLVAGNRAIFKTLEDELAVWQRTEAALVFSNGYMANSGLIPALVGRNDVVFSDRLNHASMVDGIVLSRAEYIRYRHNDMEHLKYLLARHRDRRRKLIVTDAVFSMDGDRAPLEQLVLLKRDYGAMLMVDEAHSGGVYGEKGEGLAHCLGLHQEIDIHMGTFSKAFGIYGAYVCGNETLIRWLINKAKPLIYSTALPPSVIAGIYKSLELVQSGQGRRHKLFALAELFRTKLAEAGFQVGRGDSPIVPIMAGDNGLALQFADALEAEGILAVAIRPPTVPDGTARIRFSLTAAHTEQELTDAADRIIRVGRHLGVLTS